MAPADTCIKIIMSSLYMSCAKTQASLLLTDALHSSRISEKLRVDIFGATLKALGYFQFSRGLPVIFSSFPAGKAADQHYVHHFRS